MVCKLNKYTAIRGKTFTLPFGSRTPLVTKKEADMWGRFMESGPGWRFDLGLEELQAAC